MGREFITNRDAALVEELAKLVREPVVTRTDPRATMLPFKWQADSLDGFDRLIPQLGSPFDTRFRSRVT